MAAGLLPEASFTGVPFLPKDLTAHPAGTRLTMGSAFLGESASLRWRGRRPQGNWVNFCADRRGGMWHKDCAGEAFWALFTVGSPPRVMAKQTA